MDCAASWAPWVQTLVLAGVVVGSIGISFGLLYSKPQNLDQRLTRLEAAAPANNKPVVNTNPFLGPIYTDQ